MRSSTSVLVTAIRSLYGPGSRGLPEEFRTYDFRHSHASQLIEEGANPLAVAQRMGQSAADLGLEVLVVSQFTLYADTSRGRRSSFISAARPEQAEPLVQTVVDRLRALGCQAATGRFKAQMAVELVNDGPFTILLEN